MLVFDLSRGRVINTKPQKQRRWYYQFEGKEKRELYQDNKGYWIYISKGGGKVGCSRLRDAKGNLIFGGARVWSILECN